MRTFLIIIGLFLFIGNSFAQSYEELIEKSYDFVDKGDLVSAEESLKAAMRKEPANPLNYALLTNLGTIQRRQGKLQEALISYTSALSGHTKNITILENRASLYTELGETEKALNDYNTLLIENPEHQEALYCRGLLYIQLQNYMWAEQDFDKILEVNEKSVRARLGHAILEKMRGNYDESERIFNYLISEMPRDWILYDGKKCTGNGRYRKSLYRKRTDSQPLCVERQDQAGTIRKGAGSPRFQESRINGIQ